jgi:cytochrome c553
MPQRIFSSHFANADVKNGRLRMILTSKIRFCAALMMIFVCSKIMTQAQPLVWDAVSKTNQVQFGVTNSQFTFAFTNVSDAEVTITVLRPSCGCTLAKAPPLPWKVSPGAAGEIGVDIDVRGKQGMVSKTVSVETTNGPLSILLVNVMIPQPDPRQRNQMLASSDRQAVFRNDCASCHVTPAIGKHGQELFKLACGICHEAEHRASMVPDLKALTKKTDADYWKAWVTKGKPGSLMPAFAKAEGGFLERDQIDSLVDFLDNTYRPKLIDLGNPFPVE